MKVEYFKEYSSCLQRDMEYKVYGHAGKPCIAFPGQNDRFYDYENHGIIDAISWYIDQGKIQIFCVDTVDAESWSNRNASPRSRIERQEAYFNYIVWELVPRVYEINTWGNGGGVASGILVTGCSMGAYHAMNLFLRKPDIFDAVLALSGIYHSGYFIHDYADDLTFLNSPLDSIRQMALSHPFLDLYRRAKIVLCVGQGAWEENALVETRQMEEAFRSHYVDIWCDYWGEEFPHDWPSWARQTAHFLYHLLD